QIVGQHSSETFDPVTSPIIQLKNEIGGLPFFGAALVILIVSYLVILATPMKAQFGNSFGWFIGSAGISTVMVWIIGWFMVLKNKQGLSGQGVFLQTIGLCAAGALLVVLWYSSGFLGVFLGLLMLVVGVFVIKNLNVGSLDIQQGSTTALSNNEAPGTTLIQNILQKINNNSEDPSTDPFKRMFLSNKQLAEEMKGAVDLQKQRVRHAYYTSEYVRMTAKSLGHMLEMELIFPAVYKELFGVEFHDIGDMGFDGLFDEFGRMNE
ncbi:MAG: hypothetical protein HOC71_02895, partial [Candidatus Latescibacteria bacterium]|nr:hypothetical protein [Candidatus Latescibacterota bacterium]